MQYFKWLYADASVAGPLEERWHEGVILRQSPDLPGTAGTFEGHEGLRDSLRELGESYADIVWDPVEVRDLGEGRYAVRIAVSAKGHGSGIGLEDELGHLVELRDGKVFRLDVFMSFDDALEAAGVG